MRPSGSYRSDDSAIATTVEYVLLLGVSMAIFMALYMAFCVFADLAEDESIAVAARRVAIEVSSAAAEAVAGGDAGTSADIDLPESICGRPYVVYPSRDGKRICVRVMGGEEYEKCEVPMPVTSMDVRVAGYMTALPAKHSIDYLKAEKLVVLR
jgi:hypothetical protein